MKHINTYKHKSEAATPAVTKNNARAAKQPAFYNRLAIPGFREAPPGRVLDYCYKGITKGAITTRASSLAFNFFLALFPAIIFLFTLISYIPTRDFQDQLLDIIKTVMPTNAYQATRATIEDIVKHRHGGLLSFGFILAVYFSTNGVNAMIEGFNRSFHVGHTRPFLKQRIVAFILTIVLALLLMTCLTLLVLSEVSLEYLSKLGLFKHKMIYKILLPGKWLFIISLLFSGISILYHYGPSQHRAFKFISPGSVFATILTVIVSLGFTYFVNNFGQYNKLYGSIGTLIVVLLWIYFNSVILLIGFELNASINSISAQIKKREESEREEARLKRDEDRIQE